MAAMTIEPTFIEIAEDPRGAVPFVEPTMFTPTSTTVIEHQTSDEPLSKVMQVVLTLEIVTALVLSTFAVAVVACVFVVRRVSRPASGPFSSTAASRLPPFLSLVQALGITSSTRSSSFPSWEWPSLVVSLFCITLTPAYLHPPSTYLSQPFDDICQYVAIMAILAIVPTVSFIPWRKVPRGGVVDMPTADCVENDAGSLLVSNHEVKSNMASLPFRNLADFSLNIPQAQDTSVTTESISEQATLSLYVTVPAQNSISRAMNGDIAVGHDTLGSVGFYTGLASSLDISAK
ncbi:uncharacterized protein BT62DRAFT_246950 [Guyanagaster necrorhizus]|uniref:Uncharacterized protein n=1 Tax=Guyanagaster necrorhizus TaxID=856835 RepID=A0A9P7VR80_9AGAR|nr:uncharacterized protein BT62DRAFT_246950 [Guyanagaster necrorhizus MCA 3950]KAG7444506.1 hypothetical protein BT62DRAFT_246950 [Guyanagaster necrorhizus MCA 3950]